MCILLFQIQSWFPSALWIYLEAAGVKPPIIFVLSSLIDIVICILAYIFLTPLKVDVN